MHQVASMHIRNHLLYLRDQSLNCQTRVHRALHDELLVDKNIPIMSPIQSVNLTSIISLEYELKILLVEKSKNSSLGQVVKQYVKAQESIALKIFKLPYLRIKTLKYDLEFKLQSLSKICTHEKAPILS